MVSVRHGRQPIAPRQPASINLFFRKPPPQAPPPRPTPPAPAPSRVEVGRDRVEFQDACAQVCIVDGSEAVLLHTLVRPDLPVADFRSEFTGALRSAAAPLRRRQAISELGVSCSAAVTPLGSPHGRSLGLQGLEREAWTGRPACRRLRRRCSGSSAALPRCARAPALHRCPRASDKLRSPPTAPPPAAVDNEGNPLSVVPPVCGHSSPPRAVL